MLRLVTGSAGSTLRRTFHASAYQSIAKGSKIPGVSLDEDAPSQKVNLSENKGKYLLIGVPGAFSPGCSKRHIPGYLSQSVAFKQKGISELVVVSVNDAFVTSAWKEYLLQDAPQEVKQWLHVLADPKGEFSKSVDATFDATKFFGNARSQRYAALVENGEVQKAWIEEDGTGIKDSEADKVLGELP